MGKYEYRLIINETGWWAEMESEVNKAIQEGWRPLGGIAIARSDDVIFAEETLKLPLPQFKLVQAMTREGTYE